MRRLTPWLNEQSTRMRWKIMLRSKMESQKSLATVQPWMSQVASGLCGVLLELKQPKTIVNSFILANITKSSWSLNHTPRAINSQVHSWQSNALKYSQKLSKMLQRQRKINAILHRTVNSLIRRLIQKKWVERTKIIAKSLME